MPQVTNKITKQSYHVSDKGLQAIQSNPVLAKAYTVTKADVPDEVKRLMQEMKIDSVDSVVSAEKEAKTKHRNKK